MDDDPDQWLARENRRRRTRLLAALAVALVLATVAVVRVLRIKAPRSREEAEAVVHRGCTLALRCANPTAEQIDNCTDGQMAPGAGDDHWERIAAASDAILDACGSASCDAMVGCVMDSLVRTSGQAPQPVSPDLKARIAAVVCASGTDPADNRRRLQAIAGDLDAATLANVTKEAFASCGK